MYSVSAMTDSADSSETMMIWRYRRNKISIEKYTIRVLLWKFYKDT